MTSKAENAENFSLQDFFDQGPETFESKLSRFAAFARSLQNGGVVMREVRGPARHRVSVRHPVTREASELLMFGSNNYLGLANEKAIIESTVKAVRRFGVGCGGPPLLNGMTSLHRTLEKRLAKLKGCEDAMIFSSGYSANVGWVTGLLASGDVLVYDEQSHASLYDGIRMGRTRSVAFAHNDVDDLRRCLMQSRWQRAHANIVVCIEGVYSMDGDVAPLPEIRKLCNKYGALLAVDEAHATGVLGPKGGGTAEHFGMEGQIDLVMGTFSKVFAGTGAFIAGKRDLIDYLRFFARSYMFSASLPPPAVASVLAGLDFIEVHPERVAQLHQNVRYFVDGLRAAGFDAEATTAIVPIFVPPTVKVPDVVRRLHEEGLFVNGIEYPAVPKDRQRLRLSLMATMSHHDLDFAVDKLAKVAREFGFLEHVRPSAEPRRGASPVDSQIKPEERLLVLMSYAKLEPAELAEAKLLAPDWNALVALAEENASGPLVLKNLEACDLAAGLPKVAASRLREAAEKVRVANEARLAVGKKVLASLAERGVPVVILKGVLFAETLYKDAFYKKMNDIDILVRREDLDTIYEVYATHGLFSAAELASGSPRKQEKFSHHAPPFFSRDLTCMIGTHWGLITPLAPYHIDYDAIWSRVQDVAIQGVPAKSMAPEDNLHHLGVHLPYYKTGVRELADIYNLVRHHAAEIDWELFLGEVKKAKTENLVYHALSLSNRICPRGDVEQVLGALRPRASWYFVRDTDRKTESLGRLLRSRSVHMSRIEKAYADFSVTKAADEKRRAYARIIGGILYPPSEDVAKLSSIDRHDGSVEMFVGRVAAPWRISRVLARDLGGGIYAAMLAKATFDVCRATVESGLARARSGRDEDGTYSAYAEKLGVSVEALARLKDGLE